MELQIGQLITAPFLPASAEVKKFEPRQGYYQLEVLLRNGSNQYLSKNISAAQLAQIKILERNPVALTDNAEDFFFLIEAHRLRLAYQFDPQLAVSISQVDPLPHQIEAVYHYVLESPRIRFLIADDPGAGSTSRGGSERTRGSRPRRVRSARRVRPRSHRARPRRHPDRPGPRSATGGERSTSRRSTPSSRCDGRTHQAPVSRRRARPH